MKKNKLSLPSLTSLLFLFYLLYLLYLLFYTTSPTSSLSSEESYLSSGGPRLSSSSSTVYGRLRRRKLRTIGLGRVLVEDRQFFRPALIPMTPLTSPYQQNPSTPLPEFLSYNPFLLSIPEDQQEYCGSCWAFSIAYFLADRTMMYTAGKFREKNLSAQQLLSCFSFPDGCEGEAPELALDWMAENEVLLQLNNTYPYLQDESAIIDKTCPPRVREGIGVRTGTVKSIVRYIEEKRYEEYTNEEKDQIRENIENMKRELVLNGPFYCAMTVYQDLYSFLGGKVYSKGQDSYVVGGHAVEIVGYADEYVDNRKGFSEPYWIVKNTWGLDWPRNGFLPGYFCIKMGENMCGIESRCGSAVPNVSRVNERGGERIRFQNISKFLQTLDEPIN